MDPNYTIWKNNNLPRNYPEDLKFFKKTTFWHTIVMWRKTYESIWKPLPNRRNIVITTQKNRKETESYDSIEKFLEKMNTEDCFSCKMWWQQDINEIFVIWWAEIYKQFFKRADYLYITEIHKEYDWDTYFPDFKQIFKEISRQNKWEISFVKYKRIPSF